MSNAGFAAKLREHWPLLLIVVAASVMILMNLGDQCLWQDEAETALVARTILTNGIPLGNDGKNSFCQEEGVRYGRGYVWRFHPWFQFYWLALFFALFGTSTFVARLPFALCGIATVAVAYLFARSLWGTRRAGVLAAVMLLANVSFLILARQCRYYAPTMLFSLTSLYAYWAFIEGRKRAGVWFVLSAVLLFHSHYTQCAAVLGTTILHCLIFHRDRFKAFSLLCSIIIILALPWIVWLSGTAGSRPSGSLLHLAAFYAGVYLSGTARHIFPLWVLPILLVVWAVNAARGNAKWCFEAAAWKWLALLTTFAAAGMLISSVAAPYPHFRYLGPSIAVFALVLALIAESVMRMSPVLGLAVVAIVVFTNPLGNYTYEITHHFDGPIDGIVKYLRKHAHKNDVVLIAYEDLPVKFYTDLRVLGGLTNEDLTPARKAEWVIVRRHMVSPRERAVRRFVKEQLRAGDYTAVRLDYPDTRFENREDPDEHLFRTATGEEPVVILRRTREHVGRQGARASSRPM